MSDSTKRILSTIAIVIASVTFGVLVSADLGLLQESKAQTTGTVQTPSGAAVPSVTIPSFADLAARATPAVVSIRSTEIVQSRQRRGFPFEFFFPDGEQPRLPPGHPGLEDDDALPQRSGGSGFIISPDGFILTNNHVIEGATKVEVTYGADENGAGGRTVPATIVGRDPTTDIALVKINVDGQLPALRLGDSNRIRRGDWAIAIGNPLGDFANSLTVGVISGKGRRLFGLPRESQSSSSFDDFIQTDAAINPGNSGGPLLNIAGEVIGINTAISGNAQGLGFASPINTAKILLPQLKQGKVTRGFLGMTIGEVNDEVREAFGLPEARGALVQSVTPGKPAEQAGIKRGDVIISIDDRPIRNNRELIDYISYLPLGTNVKVTLIRDGKTMTVTAKTARRDDDDPQVAEDAPSATEPAQSKLGMTVQGLTPETRRMYGLGSEIAGVLVTDVKNVSAAADAGIIEGTVIQEVQGQRVETLEQFRSAVERLRSGQRIRMYVTRPNRAGAFSGYVFLLVP